MDYNLSGNAGSSGMFSAPFLASGNDGTPNQSSNGVFGTINQGLGVLGNLANIAVGVRGAIRAQDNTAPETTYDQRVVPDVTLAQERAQSGVTLSPVMIVGGVLLLVLGVVAVAALKD